MLLLTKCVRKALPFDVKWRSIMTQLVQEDTQTPDIDSESLLLLLEELWREVLSGAADRRSRVLGVDFAGESEVGQFGVVLLVEEDVF